MLNSFAAIVALDILVISSATGFNIEASFPSLKSGDAKSLFGFSIAGHQIHLNGKGLIVGAPFDGKSGSVFWCLYKSEGCRRVDVNINKVAQFSYTRLGRELFGYALSTLPLESGQFAVACSPRLSYEVTGKVFVTGGCFTLENHFSNMTFLGASTCLNIAEASRSIDLRFCLDGASVAYLRNSNADIIISGSPYYQFAKGSGFVYNNTGFNPVRRTDTTFLDDYSLMGSSSAISDSVYNPSADNKKTTVAVFGAPGVPQSGDKNGSGFVMLNVIEKASSQRLIMKSQLLHGSLFGSRFGHAVNFIDLNGDGWDDLIVGAPFERDQGENGILHQDFEGRGMQRIPSFGCVYVYWNQQQRLPSTDAFSDGNVQVIRAPTTLSPLSGFGSAITSLGDIDHDGINDFAIGAPYDESGGVVVVYHGSASKHIGPPTQLINASELSGSLQGLGFSLGLGGLDLDDNGYPDLAVGAPNSDKVVVFRTRPVIKGEALVVLEDGSTHFKGMLDNLEDCTWDTQIMLGYWAPKVHCMNVKVIMTFYNVDPISCQQRSIPAQLLLTIDPPENWLTEEFKKNTSSQTQFPLGGGGGGAVASFFGERVLQVTDPEVRPFYQLAGDNVPLDHEQSLPFLLLPTQRAVCRSKSMLGQPPSQDELALATTVRLAFRDINLVDLSSPLRFGVKWILNTPAPSSAHTDLKYFPISNPKENTNQPVITFANECQFRECHPILDPKFEYSIARDKDGPVVFVGDDEFQSIEVRVTVTNRGGDPSYATSVRVSYPEELLDLNTSSRDWGPRPVLVRPGTALCHFGNPLLAWKKTTCALRFNVLGQQLTKAPKYFTINSTITSSPTFPPKILAPMTDVLTVKVKMSVNVTVSGEILPDAAYYSGNVTDGILVNNGENKIGATRLLVRVRVQNLRKHSLVPNSRLVIDWPYETADVVNEENGKFLFYLLEKPYVTKTEFPTSANTTIVCDSRALDKLVNPYDYRVFKSLRPQPRGDPVATAHVDLPPNHPTKYPQLKSELEIDEMPDQSNVKRFTTRLSCYNGQLRCVPIVCDLGPLSYRAGAVSFEMPARLWDNTMRQDFKGIFMTAVQITVTWRASVTYAIDMGDTDHASNSFELKIFNDMEPEPVYPKNMPLYIGLAVFAGLLLLSILVIILWKAKFFERKKFKRRFQRTKTASEGPKQPSPESQHLNSPDPSLQRPVNIHFAGERHLSLHSPPISAYGTMNS